MTTIDHFNGQQIHNLWKWVLFCFARTCQTFWSSTFHTVQSESVSLYLHLIYWIWILKRKKHHVHFKQVALWTTRRDSHFSMDRDPELFKRRRPIDIPATKSDMSCVAQQECLSWTEHVNYWHRSTSNYSRDSHHHHHQHRDASNRVSNRSVSIDSYAYVDKSIGHADAICLSNAILHASWSSYRTIVCTNNRFSIESVTSLLHLPFSFAIEWKRANDCVGLVVERMCISRSVFHPSFFRLFCSLDWTTTIKMGVDKSVRRPKSKKSLFTRLTEKLISQPNCSTRDQSVQTSFNSSTAAALLLNHRLRQHTCSSQLTPSCRPRSSCRTFLLSCSPKSIPFLHRIRQRSTTIKTPKRASSHSLVSISLLCIQSLHSFF